MTPAKKLFTRPRLLRLRRAGLLPVDADRKWTHVEG